MSKTKLSSTHPGEVVPHSEALTSLGYFLHSWSGYVLIGAIVLHAIGALKHHMLDKDATLKRMLGAN